MRLAGDDEEGVDPGSLTVQELSKDTWGDFENVLAQ
jgi:hypothetical protein